MSTTTIENRVNEVIRLYREVCATVSSTQNKLTRMETLLDELRTDDSFPPELKAELTGYQEMVAQIKEQFSALPKED